MSSTVSRRKKWDWFGDFDTQYEGENKSGGALMAEIRTESASGQIRTLFSLGRVGDRADGEILAWFRNHHAEAELAFAELLARHGRMVLEVCRRVLRDPHDVEDAFQATFLVLVRRAGSIRNQDAVGGWLHRVAMRVALRARAEAARRRDVERAAAIDASDVSEDQVERADLRTALHEELDRIPGSYRAALVACYLEGLTHEEAASRLRLPVGTVRSRLSRGRDRLRDRIARRGLAPGIALPVLARPALLPAGLHKRATDSMLSHLAGRAASLRIPASSAALAERVMRSMNLRALWLFAAGALAIGAVAGTLLLATLERARAMPPKPTKGQVPVAQPDAARSLGGIVRDSEGQPVAGATVVAGAFSQTQNHLIGTSGPDGRFAFKGKGDAAKLEYVVAYKEGHAPASNLLAGFNDGTTSVSDVELVLLTPEPFVGIIQGRDGRAVAGARVRIRRMRGKGGKIDDNPVLENVVQGTPLESLFLAITDKSGEFRFPAVPVPQRVVLAVSADGLADFSTEIPGDYNAGYITGTAANPARLSLEPEARLSGRIVTTLRGVSVAGVKVGLQSTRDSTQFWRDAITDADGRFEMRGLPEGGGNLFPFDHPSDGTWTYRAIDNLALHPGKTSEATIELIEGVLVEGRLAEADTGKPMAGALVGMKGPARPRSGAATLLATTDKLGRYLYRLPAGETSIYIADAGAGPRSMQTVVIPAGARTYTVPTIDVDPRAARARPPGAPLAFMRPPTKEIGEVTIPGLVCDVSDQPVGGTLVVGAILRRGAASPRAIVRANTRGHFTLKLAAPKDPDADLVVCALHEGLAPAFANMKRATAIPGARVKLVLARTRPFVGIVQDHRHRPIGRAEVRVQSVKMPVTEGAGTTIVEVPWPLVAGTPLEGAFSTTTDEKGMFRFPSMPARSLLNLVVTARGMVTHRTSDFGQGRTIGMVPSGFNDGFLQGTTDAPATLYLAPEGQAGGRAKEKEQDEN